MSSEKPTCLVLKDKVPAGWDVCLLQEVTDFQEGPGILAKDFHESGVPLLRLKNIETPTVRLEGCNFLDPEKVAKKWAHFALRENDLLISTSASLGRVSVVDPASAGSIAYTGIIRFRSSDPARLDRGYLRAFLSSAAFVEQAEQMATGSVIRHFGPSHLKQMAISLPSLPEQRQIADISDALDDRIALLRETNATLEAMAQALFKSWFVDFDPVHANAGTRAATLPAELQALFPSTFTDTPQGPVPEGWRVTCLSEICQIASGKRPEIRADTENEGAEVPLYGGAGIMGYTDKSLFDEKKILTGRVGTLGKVHIATPPFWASDNVLVLTPKNQANFYFSLNWLLAIDVHSLNRGSSQPLLTQKDLGAQQRALPSNEILVEFEKIVGDLYLKIHTNSQQAKTIATLRDMLLPRLISGQLRLPEAEALVEGVN